MPVVLLELGDTKVYEPQIRALLQARRRLRPWLGQSRWAADSPLREACTMPRFAGLRVRGCAMYARCASASGVLRVDVCVLRVEGYGLSVYGMG